MTQERIQTQYRLDGPISTRAELEQAIARTMQAHRQDFFPLLERLSDEGNPGVNLSQDHPPRVLGIELDKDGIRGLARLGYESNYFEDCLIVDVYERHRIEVPFSLNGDLLIFDIELPIAWNFNK